MTTKDPIADLIDRSEEMARQFIEQQHDQWAGTPYGSQRPTVQEKRAFLLYMYQQYPPAAFQMPDGRIVVDSPWALCLKEDLVVDGAKEWASLAKALGEGA